MVNDGQNESQFSAEVNSRVDSGSATVLVPLLSFLTPLYPGGPDHGQHGAPPPGSSAGCLPESHHPAGHPAHAPWLPARLCARAQRQHWIAAAAQLVCPNCKGKWLQSCVGSIWRRKVRVLAGVLVILDFMDSCHTLVWRMRTYGGFPCVTPDNFKF